MNNRTAWFLQAARGPVLLITVGILFAMQQAGVLEFSRSWPLLIIAIGVMKLLERMAAGPVPPTPVPPGSPTAGTYGGASYPGGPAR
jgi:hypothetical protein